MAQAMLHTDRIRLVPLGDEHLDLEVELDSDPEVMRYLTGSGRTRPQVEKAHQGLAAEGSRALVRHAFEDLDLERVCAVTMAVNERSQATMAAAGLKYVRVFSKDDGDDRPGAIVTRDPMSRLLAWFARDYDG